MADFELDQESVARATALSSRLMNDVRAVAEGGPPSEMRRKVFSERRYSEQAEGVPISDVVANVGRMATEFAMARRWDSEIPCVKLDDGDFAPISITEFFGGSSSSFLGSEDWFDHWERRGPFPFHRLWRETLRDSGEDGERLIATSVPEAEERVERSLQDFLSYRFAGIKAWAEWIRGSQFFGGSKGPSGGIGGDSTTPPPLAVGPGGGLQVQVSCLTPGLRIHVSPAYFISWVYFGSPSTPVSSYVLPGRYVFAGDGPMLPRRKKDHAVFSIPPTSLAALTRF